MTSRRVLITVLLSWQAGWPGGRVAGRLSGLSARPVDVPDYAALSA